MSYLPFLDERLTRHVTTITGFVFSIVDIKHVRCGDSLHDLEAFHIALSSNKTIDFQIMVGNDYYFCSLGDNTTLDTVDEWIEYIFDYQAAETLAYLSLR